MHVMFSDNTTCMLISFSLSQKACSSESSGQNQPWKHKQPHHASGLNEWPHRALLRWHYKWQKGIRPFLKISDVSADVGLNTVQPPQWQWVNVMPNKPLCLCREILICWRSSACLSPREWGESPALNLRLWLSVWTRQSICEDPWGTALVSSGK